MTIDTIERLLPRLERTDVTAFELSDGASRLTLRFAPKSLARQPGRDPASAPPEVPAQGPTSERRALRASAIGLFHLDHPAATSRGDDRYPRVVRSGEIVAFLEAGSCLRPVVVGEDCTIGGPLPTPGSLVGYGTPLFPLL